MNCTGSGLDGLPNLSMTEVNRIDLLIMTGTAYCRGGEGNTGKVVCRRGRPSDSGR